MDAEKAISLIEGTFWKFAKTMAWTPHWYCLRENFESNEDFEYLWNFVRDNSQPIIFGKKTWMVCNIDEYRYWVMTDNVSEAILINRTFIDNNRRRNVNVKAEIEKNEQWKLAKNKAQSKNE